MLDSALRRFKLIDLDKLDNDGDYIRDIAWLIEDVCVFRFVFDEDYRFFLAPESIELAPDGMDTYIRYPAFGTDATDLFQQQIMQGVTEFAEKREDTHWKPRLWLALATSLLSLVHKQTQKEYATVIYVEAIRLLDELVAHFEGRRLDDIPFRGEHPVGVDKTLRAADRVEPSWYQDNTLLTVVHDMLLRVAPDVKCKLTGLGENVQYFGVQSRRPFAVLDGGRQPALLRLAISLRELRNTSRLAMKPEDNSFLKTAVEITSDLDVGSLLNVVEQAYSVFHGGDSQGK